MIRNRNVTAIQSYELPRFLGLTEHLIITVNSLFNSIDFVTVIMIGVIAMTIIGYFVMPFGENLELPEPTIRGVGWYVVTMIIMATFPWWYTPAQNYQQTHEGSLLIGAMQAAFILSTGLDLTAAFTKHTVARSSWLSILHRIQPGFHRWTYIMGLSLLAYLQISY